MQTKLSIADKSRRPLRALWGAKGTIGPLWDVLATWRDKATSTVTGRSLDCGHFLQEECPEETLRELQHFFGAV
jgi:haloacetate dehalogenase